MLGVQLPKRQVLADDVYDILRTGLLTNRIPPGGRIVLDQVSRELGISNTPIRQALTRLESEGLVSKEAYRGWVASFLLDRTAVEELYSFRLMIEPATARAAAENATQISSSALREAFTARAASLEPPKIDVSAAAKLRDTAFHRDIALIAGNSLVVNHLERALNTMDFSRLYNTPGVSTKSFKELEDILIAIESANPAAAQRAMKAHLHASRDRMRHAFA